jgi:hypothetical protein
MGLPTPGPAADSTSVPVGVITSTGPGSSGAQWARATSSVHVVVGAESDDDGVASGRTDTVMEPEVMSSMYNAGTGR